MEGYYALTVCLDLEWRKANEYEQGNKPSSSSKSSTPSSAPTRLRKLTEEDRARYLKEGICFHCRKEGHMAQECTTFPSTPTSSSSKPANRKICVTTQKPSDPIPPPGKPINRIRALYTTLSESEKEEVVNIAEAEGF